MTFRDLYRFWLLNTTLLHPFIYKRVSIKALEAKENRIRPLKAIFFECFISNQGQIYKKNLNINKQNKKKIKVRIGQGLD